jgi:hypothetical protein
MPLTVPAHTTFPRLVAPDDAALARALGAAVVHRETVHAWPLSWVERVRLADGRTYACKTQLPPTVEPEFYARARSTLLPAHVQLTPETIALDWVEAPLLSTVRDPDALLAHGRAVVGRIGELDPDLPTYLDIAGTRAWRNEVEWALDGLARFPGADPVAVAGLRTWAAQPGVLRVVDAAAGIIHGDLTPHQVFLTPDGYRVIDWQRPVRGPSDVDLVALLVHSRLDPGPHLDPAAIGIYWLLLLHWAVRGDRDVAPGLPLFRSWVRAAINHILAA